MSEPQPANYEFSENENYVIKSLASAMRFVAGVEICLGILNMILAAFAFMKGAFGNFIVYTVTGIITVILAAMLNRAGSHFHGIVDTKGSDIEHTMAALGELKSYFVMKKILYLIAIALIIVGIVVVVLFATRSTPG